MTEGMPQWQLAELASGFGGLLGMPLDLTWDGHGVRLGTEGNGLETVALMTRFDPPGHDERTER